MDNRRDVHDFLVSRRARVTPRQAGLPVYGDKRRVPGLRREEVASLAGMSVDYYARLERGDLSGVSDPVLESLARALQLGDAERDHLLALARAAATPARSARPTRAATPRVRESVRAILRGMTGVPAYVRTPQMNIVAANDLGHALYHGVLGPDRLPVNLARFVFLDPLSPGFYLDWETVADNIAATLRGEAGRRPADRTLSDLVGELSTRSDAFATRWARHDVRAHRTAAKRMHHPVIGDIALTGDALELPGDDLTIIAYTAVPGSRDADQVQLLATWAATERETAERTGADQAAADRPHH